jgi:hypothetical protein
MQMMAVLSDIFDNHQAHEWQQTVSDSRDGSYRDVLLRSKVCRFITVRWMRSTGGHAVSDEGVPDCASTPVPC